MENSLCDMYSFANGVEKGDHDPIYVIGPKCIDSIAATCEILKYIDSSLLLDFNEIINIDHQGCAINIDLKDYFRMSSFNINKVDTSTLNSWKASHKAKFVEKVKEYIEKTQLQQLIDVYYNTLASDKVLEQLD